MERKIKNQWARIVARARGARNECQRQMWIDYGYGFLDALYLNDLIDSDKEKKMTDELRRRESK